MRFATFAAVLDLQMLPTGNNQPGCAVLGCVLTGNEMFPFGIKFCCECKVWLTVSPICFGTG